MTKEEKCSAAQVGRIVVHNGDSEKRILVSELDEYLNCGWEKGFSEKHKKTQSENQIGKEPWNKGKTCLTEERLKATSEHVSETLKERYKSGQLVVWNSGLTSEDERVRNYCEKSKQTKIQKFGNGFGNNNMNAEHKRKISQAKKGHGYRLTTEKLKQKLEKDYQTRKKNGTFNSSKPEDMLYIDLLEQYKDCTVFRNYKCDRYPYRCDFYILEEDLFIELNLHWTHGGMRFDSENEQCINQLNLWKEKAKQSKFYEAAIETWTKRDVEKFNCAKMNNLNYTVIY